MFRPSTRFWELYQDANETLFLLKANLPCKAEDDEQEQVF